MDSVKRFDMDFADWGERKPLAHDMIEMRDGNYVLYTDYAALKQRADRLAEALEAWARVETGSALWTDEATAKQRATQALADYRKGE